MIKATIIAEAHHDGRKTKGQAEVWNVRDADKVVVSVSSMQGYAPGARGYSSGGVAAFSAAEARELAAQLLAAADEADEL
jgi:hypothetical protein